MVWLDGRHVRLAKTIANLRGLTIKDYLGQKIVDDSKNIPSDIVACQAFLGVPVNPPKRRLSWP